MIFPVEDLKEDNIIRFEDVKAKIVEGIEVRLITDSHELDNFTQKLVDCSEASEGLIQFRFVDKLS